MIQVSRCRVTSRIAPLALRFWVRLSMVSAAPTAARMISGM